MKYILYMITIILAIANAALLTRLFSSSSSGSVVVETHRSAATQFCDLLDAIEQVESGGNAAALGDNGNAVGSFQIWKIYVDDVNRISNGEYEYNDRYDRKKSREMVTIYLRHYGGTIEEMARKHNGGPSGHRKESTIKYWKKVRKELR